MKEWIAGRNPVYEVLRARRRQFYRLLVAETVQEKGRLAELLDLCAALKLPIERIPRSRLDSLATHHQGVILEASGYPYSNLEDIFELAARRDEMPLLLVLDALQDPQNLGTLLRTAEAVGVHGVVLPFRRTATITPAVVQASSGACEHLLVAQMNLAQALERIKEEDIWVIGLESSTEAMLVSSARLDGPLALVVGNEAEGIRPLLRSSCDWLVRLPMRGRVASLNAASAGSIALYLAWQARSYV